VSAIYKKISTESELQLHISGFYRQQKSLWYLISRKLGGLKKKSFPLSGIKPRILVRVRLFNY